MQGRKIYLPEKGRIPDNRLAIRRPVENVRVQRSRHGSSYLGGFKINEDMVVVMNRVGVCIGFATSSLEVFATNETPINIDV